MNDVSAHVYKRKFTKQEVGYEHPAKGNESCGQCIHFQVLGPKRCEIVKGVILAEDWCRKYVAK